MPRFLRSPTAEKPPESAEQAPALPPARFRAARFGRRRLTPDTPEPHGRKRTRMGPPGEVSAHKTPRTQQQCEPAPNRTLLGTTAAGSGTGLAGMSEVLALSQLCCREALCCFGPQRDEGLQAKENRVDREPGC